MNVRLVSFAVLLTVGAAFRVEVKTSLKFDEKAASEQRPVTKVITLLKDMQKQLEKEAKDDQDIYDAMVCWCTTNDKDKTKAIADAEGHLDDLDASIKQGAAASARLNQEISTLQSEVEKNQEALDQAKALREKQLTEFQAEEKDLLQSIGALGDAIQALSKHNSFMQISHEQRVQIATSLHHEMHKHAALLKHLLRPAQKSKVLSFMQAPEDSEAAPSGQIFGILKQMKEEFEGNLANSQKEEIENQKSYEDLKDAKEGEIAAAEEQIEGKTEELATTDEKLANDKQDVEDTSASKAADEEFLVNLKEKCKNTDAEFEERLKSRQIEIQAVGKALAILSSDEAFDTFGKTFNSAFLQKESATHSRRRNEAAQLLTDVARKHHNPTLMALAVRVRLDAFTKVKKAIDDTIAELLKQQEAEVKHKDFCTDGLNENTKNTNDNLRQKKDLEEVIADLTMTIDTLTKAIATLKTEIAEMQVEMKRAGENREKESKEFQQVVADQRATQALLTKALTVLQGVYKEKTEVALDQQTQEPAGPPPPPGFKSYKKNAGAGGVMGMIEQIVSDAKAMEAEALKGEADAQAAYEEFVKDSNVSIEEKSKDIVNKSEEKAKTEDDKAATEEDLQNVEQTLEELAAENDDLHKACDFVLKNFDIRQSARMEEVEALKQAKAILSGSKFSEFLQSMPY